jgi:predicted Fe-Mo cluster-binding NifX family protein
MEYAMILAISSLSNKIDDLIDPRFGRARYFILIETDTEEWSVYDNTINMNASQGAGIQSAINVSDLRVGGLVTGNVGPKAFTVLTAAGIPVYTGFSGTVRDALKAFKSGSLTRTERPNVEGHWI